MMAIRVTGGDKRRSAIILGMMVSAWLGLLIAPCPMAIVADGPISESVGVKRDHDDCPHARQIVAQPKKIYVTDCCCDPAAVIGANANELVKLVPLLGQSIDVGLFNPRRGNAVRLDFQVPLHATSPPVYLTTQRLRI